MVRETPFELPIMHCRKRAFTVQELRENVVQTFNYMQPVHAVKIKDATNIENTFSMRLAGYGKNYIDDGRDFISLISGVYTLRVDGPPANIRI